MGEANECPVSEAMRSVIKRVRFPLEIMLVCVRW